MPREKPSVDEEVRDLMTWSGTAECRKHDPRKWDTRHNRQGLTILTDANREAMDICLGCPVMMQCLEHAFLHEKTEGIYGGMTDEERAEWAEKATAA